MVSGKAIEGAPVPALRTSGSRFDGAKGIKELAESGLLTSIPPTHAFPPDPTASNLSSSSIEEQLPTIDFSFLQAKEAVVRSKAIRDLGEAGAEWGFFRLVNHGVPESLMKGMLDLAKDFFDLPAEERKKYTGKQVLDPIRYGTSFNILVEEVFCWRDFLKVIVHPSFHSPEIPAAFREIAAEYSKRVQQIARELFKGISESLGLQSCYIEKAFKLEEGLQILICNYYPRCPQPELAMGLTPHSDHGGLTVLMQDEVGGLQLKHKGNWVLVRPLPNTFVVNVGDHLEILSNGIYKSVEHRAVVNDATARISIALAHGPSLDASVSPATQLAENGGQAVAYREMPYREYLEFQQSHRLGGKSCLNLVRL
ncbi:protein DMR6-LIKE OXYGENASE 1 isoform X1 [Amborella trichopoda]|uniref:Fe2OG dioxygenase domain-containing protein n=1 Tax=Amborella trichopoda TaxID=13333 RepID=W1NHT6_AMBTC|nr:protein DMR6-LIKE OXYGENASE 1 isoform X1 [Amborella trichopoda]ERM95352.1 hypothetical protein AMTR_s00008p00181360 [Amborella trichopoda]|eukprot:XP_006827936.1 protein DMR6-LIKE OXYGENASE 1 isoform X1 [Amborella trichopoda]